MGGYGRFLAAFMAALDLGPDTVLLGHSFGSIVASHFVAANPGAVCPLILVNPIAAPALEGPKGLMTKLAVLYYGAAARLPAGLGNALLRSQLIVRVMSETMAKTRDKELRRFIHAQHHAYFSAFANRDILLESFKASVGSTVCRGRRRADPAGAADRRAKRTKSPPCRTSTSSWPCCRTDDLDVIPGVGHLIHYETPEPAAGFIRTLPEGPRPRENRHRRPLHPARPPRRHQPLRRQPHGGRGQDRRRHHADQR